MSVTTVFRRVSKDALDVLVSDPEQFAETDYSDCESIDFREEVLAVADLVARAGNSRFLFHVVGGSVGTSVYNDDQHPLLMNASEVAQAASMLDRIGPEDLRRVCDIARLKADHSEVAEWVWESFGPDPLGARLIPIFEEIQRFFHRAAQRQQQVVVSWF
jgi:hypothetical protein